MVRGLASRHAPPIVTSRVARVFFQQDVDSGPVSPSKLAKMRATEARQQKKDKRQADEGKLHVRRMQMDKVKVRLFVSSGRAVLHWY